MPRRKKIVDRIGQTIWNFPIISFLVFFMSLNATLFIFHRIIIFHDFYQEASKLYKDDSFVNENICQNDNLKANLGLNYIEVCDRAEVHSQKSVFLNAFKKTIQVTYICGDISCIE